MNASNLLQSVLKPRDFPRSPRRSVSSVSSPKRDRNALNKPFATTRENVVPIASNVFIDAIPAAPQICLCSPTTHPGSFRCRFHRPPKEQQDRLPPASSVIAAEVTRVSTKQTQLITGGSAVSHSLLKVSTANKGQLRRAVTPCLHSTTRRMSRKLEATPSRLSRVVMAGDSGYSTTGMAGCDKKSLALFNITTELYV